MAIGGQYHAQRRMWRALRIEENALLNDPIRILLFMATSAVFLVLDVEGLVAVVTLAAESPLRDFVHVHFVRSLGHLEYLVVTSGAFQAMSVYMLVMAEYDW